MKQSLPFKHSNSQPFNRLIYDINYKFLNRFSIHYKGSLYDLGCGDMPYREWLLNYADSYTGVDWSNSPHELKADILADLNSQLPIEDQVADSLISLSVMEHLREPQLFLSEAFRILKPGGAMVMQVPFMWWVHEAPFDYFRFTAHGLDYMYKKAGFSNIEIYPQTGFWVMWTLKLNYQLARLINGRSLPLRIMLSLPIRLIWAIDQRIAPLIDKFWPCEGETAGYFVVAKKA